LTSQYQRVKMIERAENHPGNSNTQMTRTQARKSPDWRGSVDVAISRKMQGPSFRPSPHPHSLLLLKHDKNRRPPFTSTFVCTPQPSPCSQSWTTALFACHRMPAETSSTRRRDARTRPPFAPIPKCRPPPSSNNLATKSLSSATHRANLKLRHRIMATGTWRWA